MAGLVPRPFSCPPPPRAHPANPRSCGLSCASGPSGHWPDNVLVPGLLQPKRPFLPTPMLPRAQSRAFPVWTTRSWERLSPDHSAPRREPGEALTNMARGVCWGGGRPSKTSVWRMAARGGWVASARARCPPRPRGHLARRPSPNPDLCVCCLGLMGLVGGAARPRTPPERF
jgi:hypothetical protein